MSSPSTGVSILQDFSPSDVPCDVVERAMTLRSEHCSGDAEIPPERRLMIALVRDSIRSIVRYRNARDSRSRRLFEEESRWILSDDMDWFFAFARVCEVLDLNPASVRRSLGLVAVRGQRRPLRTRRAVRRPVIAVRIAC